MQNTSVHFQGAVLGLLPNILCPFADRDREGEIAHRRSLFDEDFCSLDHPPRTVGGSSDLAFLDTFAVFCIKPMFTTSCSEFGAYHLPIKPVVRDSEYP